MSESPEHSQEIAQCNGLVPQDSALRLRWLYRGGSLMAAFQDSGSEGKHVFAFLLDFALDHGIHRQNVSHRCARLGEMRVQFLFRVGLPGRLIETAIGILRQEQIKSKNRLRIVDMTARLSLIQDS